MEGGPGLTVLVLGGRHPHRGPHCVNPGQVDVDAEEEVGEGGHEAAGPVTEVVEQDLRENHPDYTHGGVGPYSDFLYSDQFALQVQ